MNASQPSPATEVSLTRAAKEDLLRKMYSLTHWIELVRLIGYQAIPMDKARQAIKPLADQYGKEPMAAACEVLVEIFTPDKEPFARLKPHVRRMAFQILGPEPTLEPATTADTQPAPTRTEEPRATKPRRNEKRGAKKKPDVSAGEKMAAPPSAGSCKGLMDQYLAAKEKHPNMLILFRVGDFYELFVQDAETAHKLLGLTLTTRDRTVTMAGFPHHQLEAYLHKLLKEGQRVAVCEPAEESLARGPIRREITRVVTPGRVEDGSGEPEGRAVRQPRHFVLQKFEAWMKEQALVFVAVDDVRRTTPAVAPHVCALDFIVLRGEEKLLVAVRPHLQAKHVKAFGELRVLFGSEYGTARFWPYEQFGVWKWQQFCVEGP